MITKQVCKIFVTMLLLLSYKYLLAANVFFDDANNAAVVYSSESISGINKDYNILACPDAGVDGNITICNKESYDQGLGNPTGVVDLFALLGGTPDAGGNLE